MYIEKEPWNVNYDEKEIPPYQLPKLLTCQDGTPVTTAGQWLNKRRPELLKLFHEIMYGDLPPMPDQIRYTLVSEKKDARNGLAIRREFRMDFLMNNGMRHSVIVLLYIPANAQGPVPVCCNLTFGGNHCITDEDDIFITGLPGKHWTNFQKPGEQMRRYPIDYILKRGYALAIASYHDFLPDNETCWATGIYELSRPKEELEGRLKNASAISAWAWGFSRVLDCAATQPEINAEKALCIGHSRLGKSSLWAGVNDERFKVVCVNDSGCGGAALNRRLYGETLYSMIKHNGLAFWFSEKMEPYALHPENLPFDQHELLALVAPRTLCVHSATEDQWADPKSEYLSACYATPAFELFGKKGVSDQFTPIPEQTVGTDVSYLIRTGPHDLLLEDWVQYLDAADRTFGKK